MRKTIMKSVLLVLGAVLISGCATSSPNNGGVTTRAYVTEKERVDQDMSGGNYGYIQGTPVAPDRSKLEKDRQVFVLEFTKELPEGEILTPAAPAPVKPVARAETVTPEPETPEWAKPVAIPAIETVKTPSKAMATPAETSFSDYTVQKGDTLQKISKKFYGTYGKWKKIYDANQAVIKDPNRLKAGMKLKIPMDGAKVQEEEKNGEGPSLK